MNTVRSVQSRIVRPLLFILALGDRSFSQDPIWLQAEETAGRFISDIAFFPSNPDSLYVLSDALFLSSDGGNRWDSIAPGSCCGALAVDPFNSRRLFLNATGLPFDGNALRVSNDGGLTWTELFHGICHVQVGCAAPFVESSPFPEAAIYSSLNPVFLLRSFDGGTEWDTLSLPPETSLWSIAISSMDPQIFYVSFATPVRVLRTDDGGTTWEDLAFPLPGVDAALLLAVDPRDHDVVYAAVRGFGMFKSTDGGQSWTEMNDGLPQDNGEILAIVVNPNNPDEIFLGLTDDSLDGVSDLVYATADAGVTWFRFTDGLPASGHVSTLSIDPREFRLLAGVNSVESPTASGIYQLSPAVSIAEEPPDQQGSAQLFQNSPNPFNTQTVLRFSIGRRSNVRVSLFSLLGELVGVLFLQEMDAGEHEVLFQAQGLSTGVYFYTLETETTRMVRRMTLLK